MAKMKRGFADPATLMSTLVVLVAVVIVVGIIGPAVTNVATDSNTTVGHGVGNLAGYSTATLVGQQMPLFWVLTALATIAGVVLLVMGVNFMG